VIRLISIPDLRPANLVTVAQVRPNKITDRIIVRERERKRERERDYEQRERECKRYRYSVVYNMI